MTTRTSLRTTMIALPLTFRIYQTLPHTNGFAPLGCPGPPWGEGLESARTAKVAVSMGSDLVGTEGYGGSTMNIVLLLLF